MTFNHSNRKRLFMNRILRVITAAIIIISFTGINGFAEESKFSGFLGSPAVYKKLIPAPEDENRMHWFKPGVDFSKYKKIMLDSVIFYHAEDADYKGIDPNEMKELADTFNLELVNALKDKYPIVVDPGPGVLRIRIAITNFKFSKPGKSLISSISPIGIGVNLLRKGKTGGWTGGGDVGAEMMAIDTATNDVVALGVDDRHAEFKERFSKTGSAEAAFKFWAERIRMNLDGLANITSSSSQ